MRCEMTIEEANEFFTLVGGGLYWRKTYGKCKNIVGRRVGCIADHGYRTFRFRGKQYYEHRVIFFIVNGRWPTMVDHKDRNRGNNLPENLREVSSEENSHNTETFRGYIHYRKGDGRYIVQVGRKYIGSSKDINIATDIARKYLNGLFNEVG